MAILYRFAFIAGLVMTLGTTTEPSSPLIFAIGVGLIAFSLPTSLFEDKWLKND